MVIALRCKTAGCGKGLKVKEEYAGKRVKCPGCGQPILIPAPAAVGVQAAAPPPRPAAPPPPAAAPSALEGVWRKSPLLKGTAFQVNRKVWLRKIGPDYNLSRPGSKDVLGGADFRSSSLYLLAGLFNLHGLLRMAVPRWIDFTDANGPLFSLKVMERVNNRYDLYDPGHKELLGSFKTAFSLEVKLRLLDAQGQDAAEMVMTKLSSPDRKSKYDGFVLRTPGGRVLGDITSQGFHYDRFKVKTPGLTLNRGYVGTVAPEFAGDLKMRVVILAATLVARMENLGAMQLDPMSVR
jgi:hypothetical protein